MNYQKAGSLLCKGLELTAEELEKINRLTRREFSAEELYCFRVVLCDNEVDRDLEQFDPATLEQLAGLFVGKTGIRDHQPSSQNQQARIYEAAVEQFPGKYNSLGEPYCALVARAYMVRTESNRDLILEIEAGIKKEVSVGCSMGRSVCSICGKERCGHVKGRLYDGQRCHQVLYEPQDAYECSFVAVPAQRAAGVVKQFQGEAPGDVVKRLEAAGEEGLSLTKAQAQALLAQVKQWQEQARWGRSYRERLEGDVLKYSAILQPSLPRAVMESAVKGLSVGELSQMAQTYEKMAGEKLPLKPQLAPQQGRAPGEDNGEFRI